MVLVILPDTFWVMATYSSAETQQLGGALRYASKIQDTSSEEGAPKRLRCGTIQKEMG